jgi:hypothetical protein
MAPSSCSACRGASSATLWRLECTSNTVCIWSNEVVGSLQFAPLRPKYLSKVLTDENTLAISWNHCHQSR